MTAPSIVQRRIAIAALCCVLGFALIGVRLIDLTLLQAAFSHNGFGAKFDGTRDGGFRVVVTEHKIRGPILVTHSKHDRAVGVAYPLASRVSVSTSGIAHHAPKTKRRQLKALGKVWGTRSWRRPALIARLRYLDLQAPSRQPRLHFRDRYAREIILSNRFRQL